MELKVRASVLADYGAAAAGDASEGIAPFGLGFDILPAAAIFGANADSPYRFCDYPGTKQVYFCSGPRLITLH